ncbi:MAG TPA: hypothetical protein PKN32_07040 [Bacteroidales bacterium]|nr:hypothetical protein [Bacteroidales bacterium]
MTKITKNLIYVVIITLLVVISVFVIRHFINKNPLDVDVADIELQVKIERFDKDLQHVFDGNAYENIEGLSKKYQDFFEIYNYDVISIGGPENASYLTYLSTFLTDYSVTEATKQVEKVFSDMSAIEEELTDGFKHLVYYYPEIKVPRVVSFIAGFNHSVILTENYIGIGLDKYLGSDCELYEMLEIPEFARAEMVKEQIPIDVMSAFYESEYPFIPKSENLMEYMIYNGRKLYFLDAMFPKFDEARKNKYSDIQLEFCKRFERDMWTNIIEKKLLFATDYLTIRKFVESAPFTYEFGPDSPPRAVNWLGWQIVKSYMSNNDVSIPELMEETDYQKILNLSGYDPKYK